MGAAGNAEGNDMTTTAQKIAEQFGNDGQQFTDDEGHELACVCRDMGAIHPGATFNSEGGKTRYEFRDGSAIVVQDGYAWDLRHPRCTCGWCWDAGRPDEAPPCVVAEHQ